MKIIACCFLILCCTSCIFYRKAYLASPANSISNPYVTMPLQSDSLKSAFFINSALSGGTANDHRQDDVFSFQTSLYGVNNFKNLQMFYGAGFMFGNYKMNSYKVDAGYGSTVNTAVLNQFTGNKNFSALNFHAGMNVVIPFSSGEWRAIGVETSIYREFGDYLATRQKIPDSAITFISRQNVFATLGSYSEFVGKIKDGSISGRFGGGVVLGKKYHSVSGVGDYGYFNFTMAVTIRKCTPFLQFNLATKASSTQLGFNYRFGR